MDTDLLLAGAEKLAAANTLGLSTDQALALIARDARRQGSSKSPDAYLREIEAATAEADRVAPAELRGVSMQDPSAQAAGFGLGQDDFQNLIPGDREYISPERRSQMEAGIQRTQREAQKAPVASPGQRQFENPIRQMSPYAPELGEVNTASGVQGVRDALNRVQAASRSAYGPGGIPGASAIIGRLEDSLEPGRTQASADASLGRETIRRDEARFNPASEVAEYNQRRASAEANSIARELFQRGGSGALADEAISRIPDVGSRYRAGQFEDVATREGVYVDPRSGEPIAMDEPATNAISGSNTPDTAQMVNAPKPGSAIDWVAQQMPEPRARESSGGEFPQVDITGETTLFSDRLRKEGGVFSKVSPNVRNIGEMQKAVDRVIADGEGVTKWMQPVITENPDGTQTFSKERFRGQPGADQVMEALGYSAPEKARLANAMFQLETARTQGATNPIKQAYFERKPGARDVSDVVFGAPGALPNADPGETQTPLARINRTQRIMSEGRKIPVQAGLQQLSDPLARDPVFGQVAGEPPRINRFKPAGLSGDAIEPGIRDMFGGWDKTNKAPSLEVNIRDRITKAQLVEARHNKFLADQEIATAIEATKMKEAQSDFQRMVDLEKATPKRTRLRGRIY